MIRKDLLIYGLIGYPVKHSLSPLMHNAAFSCLKIDAEYRLFEKKEEELSGFLRSFQKENIHGVNVTIPYKEKVIPFLDSISPEAKLIGAVNTIRVCEKSLEGFNTDGQGFLRHVTEDLGFDLRGKSAALIGAGGAAKAVAVYLAKAAVKKISIYDLDQLKSFSLASDLSASFPSGDFQSSASVRDQNIRSCDILINATPIGMKESDPCIVDAGDILPGMLVYDLVYNPKETKLLKIAREKGAGFSNGLGMLLYQGMIAFEIWTGRSAPKEVMRRALLEGLG